MKIFNKWDTTNIKVEDIALQPYINLDAILVPRTSGRNIHNRLYGYKVPIVERLMNKLMISGHRGKKHRLSSGHNTGKANLVYKKLEKTFLIIEEKLKKNPIEVFVKALENSAPREEITSIEYGGARYPQAVECAPLRRIDIALRMMIQGARAKSFKSKKNIEEGLADEIIKAYNNDNSSNAIAKKIELERQAESSR